MGRIGLIASAVLIVAAIVALFSGLQRVPPGEVALRVDAAGAPAEELGPGAHWRFPPGGPFVLYPLQPDTLVFPSPKRDTSYRLFDAAGNEIPLRFQVLYHVLPGRAAALHRVLFRTRIPAGVTDAGPILADTLLARLRARARPLAARVSGKTLREDGGASLARDLARVLQLDGLSVEVRPTTGGGKPGNGVHVLIMGVDAGDWLLIDPLVEAGRMPHMARLLQRGVRVDFHTLTPMLSPLLWTSIATGTTPDRHGILDFLTRDASGKTVPMTSSMRREPAFWNILTQYGITQAVVAWLASWPAEPISGTMVTDRFGFLAYAGAAPAAGDQGMTWPPEYVQRARSLQVRPETLPPSFWRRFFDVPERELRGLGKEGYRPGDLLGNFALTIATALTSTAITQDLQRNTSPRVTAVYYEMIDAVGHLCMPYAPPRQPQISERDYRRYHRAENAAYELQDEIFGKLLAGVDTTNTVVMVLSDHGMRSGDARPTGSAEIEGGEAARWHRDPGIFAMAGPGIRRGVRLDTEVDILDVAPTLLAILGIPVPRTMQGRVLTEAFDEEGQRRYAPTYVDSLVLRPEVWTRPKTAAAGTESPSLAALHTNLGLVLESHGKLDEAEKEYRLAVQASPHDANARNNLAGVLLQQGRLEEARKLLDAVHEEYPDYEPAFFNLGVLFQKTGKFAEAEKMFRSALEKDPANLKARVNLGHTLLRLDKLDEAEAEFQRALKKDPKLANAHFGLGLVAGQRGDLARARVEFEKTLELDPHHRSAAENLRRLQAATAAPGRISPR